MERSRLQAAIEGDTDARTELGEWMFEELYTFFDTPSRSLVEKHELLQATGAALLEKLHEEPHKVPRDPKEFRKWMFGFAKTELRRAKQQARRERERMDKLQHRADNPQTSVASLMLEVRQRSKQRKLLAWAIAQLPPALRAAIEGYLADRDRESIAHARGITVRRVDWLIWKAKQMLRKLVDDDRSRSTSTKQ